MLLFNLVKIVNWVKLTPKKVFAPVKMCVQDNTMHVGNENCQNACAHCSSMHYSMTCGLVLVHYISAMTAQACRQDTS